MATELTYLTGPNEGQTLLLDPKKPELILGRSSDVDICIDNKNISRKHAKFKQDIDGVWIEDLKSKNGVFVNGRKITEPVLLDDSNEIELGDIKLKFSDSNAAMLKRLSILPAFGEPAAETPEQTVEEAPKPSAAPPLPPPSPVPDYIFIGLMVLVVLGLIIGALLWVNA
jgi:pSer/pThr/pTyr-binding forkhead associated (FHA) protein